MQSRLLRIRFSEPLQRQLDSGRTRAQLAKSIGISPKKLNAMLNDDWAYVTKDAIERTADYLNLTVEDIFELRPVEFWKHIKDRNCIFLRGSGNQTSQQVNVARSDEDASTEIKKFLGGFLTEFRSQDYAGDEAELMKLVRTQNCVVIGSPKSNSATEIIISRFFGAVPFDSSQPNRLKIPFGFCWPTEDEAAEQSSLGCSGFARKKTQHQVGIADKAGVHVKADFMPIEEFRTKTLKKGRDCGVVFIANRPFQATEDVKLIVLAGFSGIGTLGAARALIRDYRQLEPTAKDRCVYGIVECLYTKPAHSEERTLRDFEWKYRKGGEFQILPETDNVSAKKKKKPKKSRP